MHARRIAYPVLLLAASLLAACSDKSAQPPAQAAAAAQQPAQTAQAAKSLEMYRQLLQSASYELAGPIGQEIVAKYPGSPEAKEVQETLTDTLAKAEAITSRRRLERLWIYQSGKESGGDQTTASIYNSQPGTDHVRLILRRHSQWGQSVYLFGSGKGFECGKSCTITTHFDDLPPDKIKAYAPPTGEPAVFITDDKAFISKMDKAEKVAFDVTPKGKTPETLVYEVAGYDGAKFGMPEKK
ncbi:MAG TPA: hypothetical protein VFV97_13240 [Rhodanobacteraceae bacterium]|nr:hypothetical protein [Rhodanobacteraceae bacterium]